MFTIHIPIPKRPAYKEKVNSNPKISPDEKSVEKSKLDEMIEEKTSVAAKAAVKTVKECAKDELEPVKKLAALIVAGVITLTMFSKAGHICPKTGTNIYITGGRNVINLA